MKETDPTTTGAFGATTGADRRSVFEASFWPLAAVLAWIIWRTPDLVEQCWGGSIKTIRSMHEDATSRSSINPDRAQELLLAELQRGRLYGSGQQLLAGDNTLPGSLGQLKQISAERWMDLRFETGMDGRDYATNEKSVPREDDPEKIWNLIEENESRKRLPGGIVCFDGLRFCRDDVVKVFSVVETVVTGLLEEPTVVHTEIAPAPSGDPEIAHSFGRSARKPRTRPERNRALEALAAVYPGGVPNQQDEPNAVLLRKVGDKLSEQRKRPVRDDSILRAAGRRI